MCLLLALLLAGCSTSKHCSRTCAKVGGELAARTDFAVPCVGPGQFVLPSGVNLGDGLTEDEAIMSALANNGPFRATLTQLNMAEGDLVQASLLTNPSFTTFIPVGVKQWEWTLYLPIEAFLLRPQREAIASSDYQRVAQELVQNGLTLVRDVRVAYADLAVAIAQWELALETMKIRQGIVDLTEARLNRGDISGLEAMTARIDEVNARADAALLEQDVVIARNRLGQLMGLPPNQVPGDAPLARPADVGPLHLPALIDGALASRPDAQAANWAIDAARHRTRVARWQFLRVDAVADANGKGQKGFEIGPGLRLDIPIFNRNQGGVIRADAEVAQAMHNRDAVHQQIVQEVRTAAAQWVQADVQLGILEEQLVPSLREALSIAEKGFADGGTDYLLVLRTTSEYLAARRRVLDQLAALRRARAELERSIGGRLQPVPEELPPPPAARAPVLEPLPPVDEEADAGPELSGEDES